MVGEVEGITSLDAEEIAVNATFVPIVTAHDLHAGIGTSYGQRCFATVCTVRARGADVLHLPWPRLVTVRARGQRAHGTNIDTHPAFFTLQVIFAIGSDNGTHAAILHAQGPDIHALAADSDAAVAQDATRPVEIHHWRPLLLFLVIFGLHVFGLGGAIGESHILQFALAAGIAHWAVQRMIAEQEFYHRFAGLMNLITVRGDDHTLADHRSAGGLQLWHFLDLHQTHSAGALQRKVRVVTE